MILQNSAVRISITSLEFKDSSYLASLPGSPQNVVAAAQAAGSWIAEQTRSSAKWKGARVFDSEMFTIKMDHPFTTSSLVGEVGPSAAVADTIELWSLTREKMVAPVSNLVTGYIQVTPISILIKCYAMKALVESINTSDFSLSQRAEYTSQKAELLKQIQYLIALSPLIWRLPEEYVGVSGSVIYVRRNTTVPFDNSILTSVASAQVPAIIAVSPHTAAVARVRSDISRITGLSTITDDQLNNFIDSAGAGAWLQSDYQWLKVSNDQTFLRTLSTLSVKFLEQEYDKYCFVMGEFVEWMYGTALLDLPTMITAFATVGKTFNRLGSRMLSAAPIVQYRSLHDVVKSDTMLSSKEQICQLVALIDYYRGRIRMEIDPLFTYDLTDIVELNVLTNHSKIPYCDWPASFQANLTINQSGEMVYLVHGNPDKPVRCFFEGSSFSPWIVSSFQNSDVINEARRLWADLALIFDYVAASAAAEQITKFVEDGETKVRLSARYSKLYSMLAYYMTSKSDVIIVPVRRFT